MNLLSNSPEPLKVTSLDVLSEISQNYSAPHNITANNLYHHYKSCKDKIYEFIEVNKHTNPEDITLGIIMNAEYLKHQHVRLRSQRKWGIWKYEDIQRPKKIATHEKLLNHFINAYHTLPKKTMQSID